MDECSENTYPVYFYHLPEFLKNGSGAKTRNQCFIQAVQRQDKHSFLSFRRRPAVLVGCSGGAKEDRTPDLLRAKQALSQLSYGPIFRPARTPRQLVGLGRFELPTSPLSGVRSNQLSYRPNRLSRVNQAIRVGAYEEAGIID